MLSPRKRDPGNRNVVTASRRKRNY